MISINDINDPQLNIFRNTSENQLYHYYEPALGLFMAESLKVLTRAINAGFEPECALIEDKVLDDVLPVLKDYPDIPIYVAGFDVLTNLTGYHMTGGVLCAMKRKALVDATELCRPLSKIAILEDVVNPTNIGAIFRNAAALNVEAVLLSPGCCDPLYKRAIRVSMGTVFQIPWTFIDEKDWPHNIMSYLKKEGFAFVAMALDDKAVSISDESLRAESKKAILLGSEGNGLREDTLEMCDYTVMIPMSHGVDSLNVAAASALAFWELAGK